MPALQSHLQLHSVGSAAYQQRSPAFNDNTEEHEYQDFSPRAPYRSTTQRECTLQKHEDRERMQQRLSTTFVLLGSVYLESSSDIILVSLLVTCRYAKGLKRTQRRKLRGRAGSGAECFPRIPKSLTIFRSQAKAPNAQQYSITSF